MLRVRKLSWEDLITEDPIPKPRLHGFCRCKIRWMEAITAGTATFKGVHGADYTLKHTGELPEYYNDDGHLPGAPGRIWYEADINYKTGKRNTQRIVWSNDGLIFVTYDHYETFYEIV